MIRICSDSEAIRYSAYHLYKAFDPDIEAKQEECENDLLIFDSEKGLIFDAEKEAAAKWDDSQTGFPIKAQSSGNESADSSYARETEMSRKEKIELALYDHLKKEYKKELPWGILTGVRPVKMAVKHLDDMSRDEFAVFMSETKRVSKEKALISRDIADRERKIISSVIGNDEGHDTYSLYVGIPVCPSVCSYCSFSSGLLSVWKDRMDEYVDALIMEIKSIAKIMNGRKAACIYIGGGTPTVLTKLQLEKLLTGIEESLPAREAAEYTLEAGRPDTITREKLLIAGKAGITRLSINPQTMQQRTLDMVGRRHTVEEIEEKFYLARELGFDNINMDIIAGLPGESAKDMQDTVDRISKLSPDSLTVHALAIKRAAAMESQGSAAGEVSKMIEIAGLSAKAMGMEPYYLYRQKSIAGNYENIGYSKAGKEGIYNIMIMEEVQSIMAVGAGATSKLLLKEPVQNPDRAKGVMTNLLRQDNPKSIKEYLARINEVIIRKEKLFDIR